MPTRINDVIMRRSDLGSFVVHLTRDYEGQVAKSNLESILLAGKIEARNAYGAGVTRLRAAEQSLDFQKCVCFTETPLQYVNLLLEEIEGRHVQFGSYGLAITRQLARKAGVNPVWYLDMTPGHPWLTVHMDNLIDAEISNGSFENSLISRLTPFIEQMGSGINSGTGEPYRKEFWWEREWRHVGDFNLPNKLIVICPESEFNSMRSLAEPGLEVSFIDSRWGLEHIIGRLAGFEKADIDAF